MSAPLAGFNCVLTVGADTVGRAQDVELSMSATEIDITTRDDSGWKKFIQGLKEWGATIDQLWVPTDNALLALRDAYLDGSELVASFADDTNAGFSGSVIITGLTFPQPLDDGVKLNVTVKGTGALNVLAGS